MNQELIERIKKNPLTDRYLKEHSYEYKELIRNSKTIEEIEKKAKKEYQEPITSKIERIKNRINTIKTIIDVIE